MIWAAAITGSCLSHLHARNPTSCKVRKHYCNGMERRPGDEATPGEQRGLALAARLGAKRRFNLPSLIASPVIDPLFWHHTFVDPLFAIIITKPLVATDNLRKAPAPRRTFLASTGLSGPDHPQQLL